MNHTFTIIKRHWLPLLGLNTLLLAATLYAATVYADKTFTPVWRAGAQVNVPIKGGNLNADLGTLGNLNNDGAGFTKEVNPLYVQSAIMTSDAVIERVLSKDPEQDLYSSLDDYKGVFEISPEAQSTIISLGAQGESPELALQRVKNLVEAYQQRLNELRYSDAAAREQFAQEELAGAQNQLLQAQNDLNQFQQSTGLVDSEVQSGELIRSISALKTQQAQLLAEARANETEARVAAASLGVNPQKAINSLRLAENTEYQAVRGQLSENELALADARSRYTDESPQVQALLLKQQELSRQLERQTARAIPGIPLSSVDTTLGSSDTDSRIGMIAELIKAQSTAQALQQQASQIKQQSDRFSAELNFISRSQVRLVELQRRYEIAEGVYKGIVAQVKQAKINTFDSYPNVQLIDGPTLNSEPTEPRRKLIVLGGVLASLFGSLGMLLFLESRKPLLSPKDIQRVDLPILGRISRLKRSVTELEIEPSAEIEFQRLASALSFLNLENRRLMVTSATFGEGKTTVTLGMAIALSKLGFRVLVVDGDLRQAHLSRRLGYSRTKLDADFRSAVFPIYPSLDFMPAPSLPTDKICEFSRGQFERRLGLVQEARDYDYIIIDSAPVSLVSETALMSTAVDSILFVVRPGNSDRYSVLDSFEQLHRHQGQIVGLVINGVESRTEGYRYGQKRELVETEV